MKIMSDKLAKKIVLAIVIVTFACFLIKINSFEKVQLISTEGQSYEKAVVTEITKDNLQEDGNRYGNQEVRVQVKTGKLKGKEIDAINPNGTLFGSDCTIGTNVIVIISSTGEDAYATVYSLDRSYAMWIFIFIFIFVVCIIGGMKGVKAVASLAFTFICIVYMMFPLMYRGFSPILLSIIVCIISTIVTLWMLGGVSRKTVSAIIGTSLGVIFAGIAAFLYGKAAGVSGYNVTDIETLTFVAQNTNIKIGQLLFAGIIISSLGAVMDVGMSIASTIQEIYEVNNTLSRKELFFSGINVGRDMMGTMINTLILAYVGGSLSTLITNYAYDLSYNQLANSYTIAIEVMQGLAGSFGVVLTVPITAAVSSFLVSRKYK